MNNVVAITDKVAVCSQGHLLCRHVYGGGIVLECHTCYELTTSRRAKYQKVQRGDVVA